jgi:hypothetical protein
MCVALVDVISNLCIIQTNKLRLLVYMNDIQSRGSKMSTKNSQFQVLYVQSI